MLVSLAKLPIARASLVKTMFNHSNSRCAPDVPVCTRLGMFGQGNRPVKGLVPFQKSIVIVTWFRGSQPCRHDDAIGGSQPLCVLCAFSTVGVLGFAGKLSSRQDDGFNFNIPKGHMQALLMVISHWELCRPFAWPSAHSPMIKEQCT